MTCNLENTISLQSGQTYETNWDRILYLTSYNPIKLMFFNFPSLSNFNQTVDISGWPPPRVPFYEQSRLNTLLLVHPVAVTLPLLSMTFPICWIIANYFALAKLVMVIEIKSGL